MKVIFLDVDGVLNSDTSLMEDISLEETLICRLKRLVEATNAKIILSSSWRCVPNAIKMLISVLDNFNLHISGMTDDGVKVSLIEEYGFKPTERFKSTRIDYNSGKRLAVTSDRGAEIYEWLHTHDHVESFVILDDEDFDIKQYFQQNFIKTSYATGLTDEDVDKAIEILNKEN